MWRRFKFLSPEIIMSVVVALVVLAVGVFAFFVTTQNIPTESARVSSAINNVTATGNTVFNIVGIVIIIGAIMSIIGIIYGYISPRA